MIEAAIPRITEFSMDAGDGLEVPYAGEPSFVEIQGTDLRRAENTPFQVIMHNNFYYLCHDGAWYSSTRAQGPWKFATEVPEAIYTIPPTDPAYNVTFVRLDSFDDSSNKVAYSHTMGYRRTYSTGYYRGLWNRLALSWPGPGKCLWLPQLLALPSQLRLRRAVQPGVWRVRLSWLLRSQLSLWL